MAVLVRLFKHLIPSYLSLWISSFIRVIKLGRVIRVILRIRSTRDTRGIKRY